MLTVKHKTANAVRYLTSKTVHHYPMSSVGKRLKLARKNAGITQQRLADLSGIAQQTIGKLEVGHTEGTKYIFDLAKALNVSPTWLATGIEDKIDSESLLHKDSISITSLGRVTVRGIVEASNWAEACEWSEDQQYVIDIIGIAGDKIPYNIEKLYALEVRGDSMDVEYKPGWRLLCISLYDDPTPLQDGENVIVRRESPMGCETTVKKLRINKDTGKYELHFHSYNKEYQGLILPLFNPKVPYTSDNVTISVVARVLMPIPTWGNKT